MLPPTDTSAKPTIAFENIDHPIEVLSLADAARIELDCSTIEPNRIRLRVEAHMSVSDASES